MPSRRPLPFPPAAAVKAIKNEPKTTLAVIQNTPESETRETRYR